MLRMHVLSRMFLTNVAAETNCYCNHVRVCSSFFYKADDNHQTVLRGEVRNTHDSNSLMKSRCRAHRLLFSNRRRGRSPWHGRSWSSMLDRHPPENIRNHERVLRSLPCLSHHNSLFGGRKCAQGWLENSLRMPCDSRVLPTRERLRSAIACLLLRRLLEHWDAILIRNDVLHICRLG